MDTEIVVTDDFLAEHGVGKRKSHKTEAVMKISLVIFLGAFRTRLWPLSSKTHPKKRYHNINLVDI